MSTMSNLNPSCLELELGLAFVFTKHFQDFLGHGWVWRSDNGDGNPYFRQSSWRWLLHVVELVLHIVRIYLTILKTVVSGLLQILWKVIRVLMWTITSTGSSSKRKYNAGTGEELLSFRKPLNILF